MLKKLANRFAENGVYGFGRNLCQRRQNESARGKAGVGNDQIVITHDEVIKQQDVQIKSARRIWECPDSPAGSLDAFANRQQLERVKGSLDLDGEVHEPRLMQKSYRLRLEAGGYFLYPIALREGSQRELEVRLAIADIGTGRDIGSLHL